MSKLKQPQKIAAFGADALPLPVFPALRTKFCEVSGGFCDFFKMSPHFEKAAIQPEQESDGYSSLTRPHQEVTGF